MAGSVRVPMRPDELAPADLLVRERQRQDRIPAGRELTDRGRWPLAAATDLVTIPTINIFKRQLLRNIHNYLHSRL